MSTRSDHTTTLTTDQAAGKSRQSGFKRAWRPRALSLATVAVLAVLALFAAACGSDDSDDVTTPQTTAGASSSGSDSGDDTSSGSSDSGDTDSAPTTTANPNAGSPLPTVGFDGEVIKLGYLVDTSGTLSIIGNPLRDGSQVYWSWLNDQGGVAGKYRVELEVADTADDPQQTVVAYERIKEDVVMFAEVLSTPPTQALVEFLEEDNIIAVPGSLAGEWANKAVLLPNGAAYEYEMINIIDWYVTESDLASDSDVYCAVSVSDKYGEDTMRGVEAVVEWLGIEIAEHQTYNRGDTEFTAQVTAFSEAGCTVVFTVSVPTEQTALMGVAAQAGLEPIWLGTLPSYLNLFAAGRPDLFENFYVTLDSPNLNDTSVPGMVNFLERYEQYSGDENNMPNTFHVSGYFQSFSVHALLEKAVELGDLSREGLATAMAQLGEVDSEGLAAENYVYGLPEDRMPTSAVRIFQFDREQPPNFLSELTLFDSRFNACFSLDPSIPNGDPQAGDC